MRKVRKYGLIGLLIGIALFFPGLITGGVGICGPTNEVSLFVMVAGFWAAASAAIALVVSVPTLIVRKLRPQEVADAGSL